MARRSDGPAAPAPASSARDALAAPQAAAMLELQAAMNARVDPDWLAARQPYLRAVVIEAAEAIEHHGWKWWKRQERDLRQLRLELVDIWHFLLSEVLLRSADQGRPAPELLMDLLDGDGARDAVTLDGARREPARLDLLERLELLIAVSAARRLELGLFAAVMEGCGMGWGELYRQYVAKNVLNMFRQDKGYRTGRYRKIWNGREDNERLADIAGTLDQTGPGFRRELYAALEAAYPG